MVAMSCFFACLGVVFFLYKQARMLLCALNAKGKGMALCSDSEKLVQSSGTFLYLKSTFLLLRESTHNKIGAVHWLVWRICTRTIWFLGPFGIQTKLGLYHSAIGNMWISIEPN